MYIKFKENYNTQLTDEEGDFSNYISWVAGDTEECRISEKYLNGVQLEFPDGTYAENVPNHVFEIVN